MQWHYILLLMVLFTITACKQNKTSKLKTDLDSISEAIDIEIENEERLSADSAKFTLNDWQAFESALNNAFKADIYNAYTPYVVMFDSLTGYDLEDPEAFLYWLNKLEADNTIDQLEEAFSLLPFTDADSVQHLVSAFVSVLKSSNKTAISEALANNIKNVVTSKLVTPNAIIEGLVRTLGKHNFDKRLCRLSAICYLISMLQIEPNL